MESPPFDESGSVTWLVERLKGEDAQAANEIWRRYFDRLLPLARSKLRGLTSRESDEEDVLVSVFDRFFRAASEGRFHRLGDRDDLWQILLMLTDRKVADQYRRTQAQKRGSGDVVHASQYPEVDLAQIREVADQQPSPEFIEVFNDCLSLAVNRLNDETTREIALLRLEGYMNREIADRLNVSLSSVERKLRVVREVWQDEFA